MLVKNATVCLLIVLVAGCASHSPPAIQNGQYDNSRYKFSCAAPASWQVIKQVPDRFLPITKSGFDDNDRYEWNTGLFSEVVFADPNGKAAIAIDINKTFFDYGKLPPERIKALLTKVLKAEETMLRDAFKVIDYHVDITPCFVTEAPSLLIAERFHYVKKTDMVIETAYYAFTVNKGDTCFFQVTLFSEADAFAQNILVLNDMKKSIKRTAVQVPSTTQK